ncbi:hypothetical protein ALC53_08805 [Atta colombica]|uniref:Uncharacterized protein n=1 Tax=Atta colombica TaxID=520822 RepID=A0A195B7Z4_9HYME|nr:hypothetical protein ALC53_08805 [Atta colombica]
MTRILSVFPRVCGMRDVVDFGGRISHQWWYRRRLRVVIVTHPRGRTREDLAIISLCQKCLFRIKFNLPPKIHNPLHHQILMQVYAVKGLGNKQEEVGKEIS